jgi:hypothetical protein
VIVVPVQVVGNFNFASAMLQVTCGPKHVPNVVSEQVVNSKLSLPVATTSTNASPYMQFMLGLPSQNEACAVYVVSL